MDHIAITTPFIRLEAALKLASVAGSGGMAKQMILDGCVEVNSVIEIRRGRKLYPGDNFCLCIENQRHSFMIVSEEPA